MEMCQMTMSLTWYGCVQVVQHVAVCLVMPVRCVLFDAQLVGELITPIKSSTTSPPKNKTNPKKPHNLPF